MIRLECLMRWIVACLSLAVFSAQAVEETQFAQKVNDLKKSVLELNKNLYQLEDELLNPSTTKAAMYFSLSVGKFYEPVSIQVNVDDKPIASHLYSKQQISALKEGAVQPLKNFNLGPGKHDLKVVVKGKDANGKEKELVSETQVQKNEKPLYLEIKISDNESEQASELLVQQW